MTLYNEIQQTLIRELNPTILEIVDNSAKHQNHYHTEPGVISHLSITIASKTFSGLSKVAQHRLINKALESFFQQELHAIEIKIVD